MEKNISGEEGSHSWKKNNKRFRAGGKGEREASYLCQDFSFIHFLFHYKIYIYHLFFQTEVEKLNVTNCCKCQVPMLNSYEATRIFEKSNYVKTKDAMK